MRKWNKLLALVLAMVMVFGLTATAFADEDTKDEETKEPTEQAAPEGEDGKTDDAAPAEGEDGKADDAAPAEGEDDKADDAAPAEGEDDKKDEPVEIDLEGVETWAQEHVKAVVEKGLFDVPEAGFQPTVAMNRGDLVLALYRLANKPEVAEDVENPFTDIADLSDEAKAAVTWAFSQKIVSGETETTFNPNGSIERQGIAKVLFVFAGDKAKEVEEDKLAAFSDKDQVAEWAVPCLNWLVSTGLMNGSDGKLLPTGTAQRQEVATILSRYITNVLGEDAEPTEPAGDDKADDAAPADDTTAPADDTTTPADDTTAPADDAGQKDDTAPAGDEKTEGDGKTDDKAE